MEINQEIVSKILETVDAGLVSGVGCPTPGQMCVEAAVCYALGLPHGDNPQCVSESIRAFKIVLNDCNQWSSPKARAAGLRRLAIAQLRTKGNFKDKEFGERVVVMTANKILAPILHAVELEVSAKHCELVETANGVWRVAHEAKDQWTPAHIRNINEKGKEIQHVYEVIYSVKAAASYIADYLDLNDVDGALEFVVRAVRFAAQFESNRCYITPVKLDIGTLKLPKMEYAPEKSDQILTDFAENVVQILIEMETPGSKWL